MRKLTRIRGRKPLTVGYPEFLTCFAKGRERSLLKELNYYGLLAIDFEDHQGLGVASNSSKELGPKCAGLLRAPSMLD